MIQQQQQPTTDNSEFAEAATALAKCGLVLPGVPASLEELVDMLFDVTEHFDANAPQSQPVALSLDVFPTLSRKRALRLEARAAAARFTPRHATQRPKRA